ncbi:MAG: substrate-binding domain-containing protein [Atribacter sp.]|jgi:ribose transport system substrate-binding protein|nr:substrate-binding domain-containing protein [Atribacterota bacterium]
MRKKSIISIRCLVMLIMLALLVGTAVAQEQVLMETRGPQGEEPTWYSDVTLTPEEIQKVKEGNYKAAYLMHTSSDFANALMAGAKDLFNELGIELVVTTDAAMDPTKQKTDVETALALKPDIILTLVIDPVAGAEAFRPAVEAGVKLVFMSNLPDGYVQGKDYVGIVTDDLFGMGKVAAEMLADTLGGKGKIAWLFHDASYYVTNQRDNAFKTVIQQNYPDIEIVAEQGIANPADSETIASALITQHPEITGFYVPWDTPAEGVVAACRAAKRPDIKIVTLDLGANNALDMAQDGNVVGIAADLAYMLGYTKAMLGVYGVLEKPAPPFVIVPAIKVTKENLVEGWRESLHQDPPPEIMDMYN